jgi:vacuolar protein sorting-associated protein 35
MLNKEDFASANRSIKENAYYMRNSVKGENAKDGLRFANTMLLELKNNSLSPKDYYVLFQTIFDELSWLQTNFLGNPKQAKVNMYEIVQYANSIIPRLYLMITVGALRMGKSDMPIVETMRDMLAMIKGVQHPCRGLFIRYFFLKIIKEKVEDNEQDLELEGLTGIFLENLRQMNNLWIRMNSLIEDKEKRRKQRRDLAICVGENLLRLSHLESIDVDFYAEKLFPQIVDIILENKDRISQEYLFNIVISTFPDDFHFKTLNQLLATTEKLSSRVNLNAIYLQLMQRFTTYAKNNCESTDSSFEPEKMVFIYEYFSQTLSNILQNNTKYKTKDLFQLVAGFMDFSVFFYNGNLTYVNDIIHLAIQLAKKSEKEELASDEEVLKSMVKILTVPFEKLALLVLKLENFPVLLNFLPFAQKSQVALKICESVINTKTYLVNEFITKKFLLFIEPLFSVEDQKEEHILTLTKTLHLLDCHSPKMFHDMISLWQIQLSLENELHLNFLYPCLVQRFIYLLTKSRKISVYISKLENTESLFADPSEFKSLFSKDDKADYLEEEKKGKLAMSLPDDVNLDVQDILSNCYRICHEIEVKRPLVAINLYMDLMIAIDQALAPVPGASSSNKEYY